MHCSLLLVAWLLRTNCWAHKYKHRHPVPKEEEEEEKMEGGEKKEETATPMASAVASTAATDDVVNKYKRLLSMARSSLEANQVDLKEKDRYIDQLKAALEEEKTRGGISGMGGGGHGSKRGQNEDQFIPRNLLRRVDMENRIWILVEYESQPTEYATRN